MTTIDTLQRFLLIIKRLSGLNRYVQSDELLSYIEKNMKMRHGSSSGYSMRTIQRDINNIEALFGIEIKNKKDTGYYIAGREQPSFDRYEELLLNFDLLSALNAESGLSKYILAEHHRPVGNNENMPQLMEAIKQNHCVEFDYTLFRHDNKIVHKKVEPHFLKESRQRWYLLAKDDGKLKAFGIGRIANLHLLTEKPFERDQSIDVDNLFRDSFGIWNQDDIPVEDVVLSYSPLDGSFIKALPLHHSQEVLTDDNREFRIRVRLRITNDFVMELLSRSTSLTVIEPASLRRRVAEVYRNALERNNDE